MAELMKIGLPFDSVIWGVGLKGPHPLIADYDMDTSASFVVRGDQGVDCARLTLVALRDDGVPIGVDSRIPGLTTSGNLAGPWAGGESGCVRASYCTEYVGLTGSDLVFDAFSLVVERLPDVMLPALGGRAGFSTPVRIDGLVIDAVRVTMGKPYNKKSRPKIVALVRNDSAVPVEAVVLRCQTKLKSGKVSYVSESKLRMGLAPGDSGTIRVSCRDVTEKQMQRPIRLMMSIRVARPTGQAHVLAQPAAS